MFKTLTMSMLITSVLSACGGAAPPVPNPATGAGPVPWVMFYADSADEDDYALAMQFHHSYVAEPMGVILATDEPSEQAARLILIDALGTEALAVRTLR